MARKKLIVDQGGYNTDDYGHRPLWADVANPIPSGLSAEEFLKKSGLDWEVEKQPCYYKHQDQLHQCVDYALIRSDNSLELDRVSRDWEFCRNHEFVDFFDRFIRAGHMEMHTAGSINGGRIVWCMARRKQSIDIFGKDRIDSYVLFTNPHQYGKVIDIRHVPHVFRCANMISRSLGRRGEDLCVRADHRKKFEPEEAYKTLGLIDDNLTEYGELAKYLGNKKFTVEALIEYYTRVFPSSNKDSTEISRAGKTCKEILEVMPNADVAPGTWWAAFNSVTYFTNHVKGKNLEERWNSLNYGTSRMRNIRALELATEYAEMA